MLVAFPKYPNILLKVALIILIAELKYHPVRSKCLKDMKTDDFIVYLGLRLTL